jgi:hypothetical protein
MLSGSTATGIGSLAVSDVIEVAGLPSESGVILATGSPISARRRTSTRAARLQQPKPLRVFA